MTYRRTTVLGATALACMVLMVAALAAADDISGSWRFVFRTDGGEREVDVSLKVDGGQVTGKFADADVKGTCKDGAIELTFPFNSPEAGQGIMSIKGSLVSGALSGAWEFAGYSGTFIARRPSKNSAGLQRALWIQTHATSRLRGNWASSREMGIPEGGRGAEFTSGSGESISRLRVDHAPIGS